VFGGKKVDEGEGTGDGREGEEREDLEEKEREEEVRFGRREQR